VTRFSDPQDAAARLEDAGYLPDAPTATTAYLAAALEKPLLVEGPAGAGKTSLAIAMAEAQGAELIRLQCYEGIDESRALYEWEYGKQLLYTQLLKDLLAPVLEAQGNLHDAVAALGDEASAFFSEAFLLPRPLLRALTADGPVVLLVDEVDKAEPEFEAFLLEVLGEFQVTIPELGTVRAERRPQVVLTSNAARELSDPLRRRCLHLLLDLPDEARELAIVRRAVPEVDEQLARNVVGAVTYLRTLDLRRAPSLSEVIDWARAVALLGRGVIDEKLVRETLGVLLKHQRDLALGREHAGRVAQKAAS
jgi:MoxR-like ATPase